MENKLYRSRRERMISGVCGGIAERTGADPTFIRLLAVLISLASAGTAVLAYIVAAIVIPEEPLQPSMEGGTAVLNASGEPIGGAGADTTSQAPPYAPPPPAVPLPPAAARPAPTPVPRHGRGGITFGLVLVFLGVALLATQFVPGLDLWRLWPLIIVAIGIRTMFQGGGD